MDSITIFSATNRPDSYTEKIARQYEAFLSEKGANTLFLSFKDLPRDIAFSEVYGNRTPAFQDLISRYVDDSQKFLFVVPEYNGGFPGILKIFLDAVHPSHWTEKKALLTGIASGRAGNLRGLEHLTGILNYLKVNVYHDKLPISQIERILGDKPALDDAPTLKAIDRQLNGFMKF